MPLAVRFCAEEVYPPPVRVTVPVGLPNVMEPVTVATTVSGLVILMELADGTTPTVVVPAPTPVPQYVTELGRIHAAHARRQIIPG